MMGFGLVWTLLIGGLIAYALGWRPEFLDQLRSTGLSRKTPLDVLKERYARGEISREEFEEMRRDMEV